MGRILSFLYGVVAHVVFLLVFMYRGKGPGEIPWRGLCKLSSSGVNASAF